MKKKNFEKKMELAKETIANLDWDEMNHIRGGSLLSDCSTIHCAVTRAISCFPTCPNFTTD